MANTSIKKSVKTKNDSEPIYSTIGFMPSVYDGLLKTTYIFKDHTRGASLAKVVNLALVLLFDKLANISDKELDKLAAKMHTMGDE